MNGNVQRSKEILHREIESLKSMEAYLDSVDHTEWKEITRYLLTFHMKFKESVFELEEFDISTNYPGASYQKITQNYPSKARSKTLSDLVNIRSSNI